MSVIPASTSTRILTGANQVVYTCPGARSHSFINIAIFNPNAVNAEYSIAITDSDAAPPDNQAMIQQRPISSKDTLFFNRLVVGPNQRVHVRSFDEPINVRLTAMEETNPNINDAGLLTIDGVLPGLANVPIAAGGGNVVILNASTRPDLVAVSCDLIVRNMDNSPSTFQARIDTGNDSATSAGFVEQIIPANDTIIIDNILLNSNEILRGMVGTGSVRAYVVGLAQVDIP